MHALREGGMRLKRIVCVSAATMNHSVNTSSGSISPANSSLLWRRKVSGLSCRAVLSCMSGAEPLFRPGWCSRDRGIRWRLQMHTLVVPESSARAWVFVSVLAFYQASEYWAGSAPLMEAIAHQPAPCQQLSVLGQQTETTGYIIYYLTAMTPDDGYIALHLLVAPLSSVCMFSLLQTVRDWEAE